MSSNQKNLISIIAALVISAVLVLGMGLDLFGWVYTSEKDPRPSRIEQPWNASTTVVRVVDGDTIVVQAATRTQSVRLTGIDDPEITWPSDENDLEEPDGECLAFAARDYLREQVGGQTVSLMNDPRQPTHDQYDRLLAYVYTDGELINQRLIEKGFARELTVGGGYEMKPDFQQSEVAARDEGAGLWSVCE